MIPRLTVRHVETIPDKLEPGVLYVSQEFETAHHLCACGCGARVRTPLGETEWTLRETRDGPSLWPSVGNWQKGCRSHYVVQAGRIEWAGPWSEQEVRDGRAAEQRRREAYFDQRRRRGLGRRLVDWLKHLLGA